MYFTCAERLLCSSRFHLGTLIEETVLWLPELFFWCDACNHNTSHRNYLLLRSCLVRLSTHKVGKEQNHEAKVDGE